MKRFLIFSYLLIILGCVYAESLVIRKGLDLINHFAFALLIAWCGITVYGLYKNKTYIKYMFLVSSFFQIVLVLLGFGSFFDSYYFSCGQVDCTYQASFLILAWAALKVFYANKNYKNT